MTKRERLYELRKKMLEEDTRFMAERGNSLPGYLRFYSNAYSDANIEAIYEADVAVHARLVKMMNDVAPSRNLA